MVHNISIDLPLFHTQLARAGVGTENQASFRAVLIVHAAAGVQRRAWRRVPAGYSRVGIPIVVLAHLPAQVRSASR